MNENPDLQTLSLKLDYLIKDVEEIKTNIVYKSEFYPIKLLVYGAVGLILTAVLTTGINLLL